MYAREFLLTIAAQAAVRLAFASPFRGLRGILGQVRLVDGGKKDIPAARTPSRGARRDRLSRNCTRFLHTPAMRNSLHSLKTPGRARRMLSRVRLPASCGYRIPPSAHSTLQGRSTSPGACSKICRSHSSRPLTAGIFHIESLPSSCPSCFSPLSFSISLQKNVSVLTMYPTTEYTSASPYRAMMYSLVRTIEI